MEKDTTWRGINSAVEMIPFGLLAGFTVKRGADHEAGGGRLLFSNCIRNSSEITGKTASLLL